MMVNIEKYLLILRLWLGNILWERVTTGNNRVLRKPGRRRNTYSSDNFICWIQSKYVSCILLRQARVCGARALPAPGAVAGSRALFHNLAQPIPITTVYLQPLYQPNHHHYNHHHHSNCNHKCSLATYYLPFT